MSTYRVVFALVTEPESCPLDGAELDGRWLTLPVEATSRREALRLAEAQADEVGVDYESVAVAPDGRPVSPYTAWAEREADRGDYLRARAKDGGW